MAQLILSCSAAQLTLAEQRKITHLKGTKSCLNIATLESVTKNLGNAHNAIQMQDKDAGIVVAKMNMSCSVFRQTGDINKYNLAFNFSAKASDNQLELEFDDLRIVRNNYQKRIMD